MYIYIYMYVAEAFRTYSTNRSYNMNPRLKLILKYMFQC